MKYNFDEIVARRATNCVKWDECPSADVIPMWVADMDFRVAPAIQQAVEKRAAHGVFGYTIVGPEYYEAIQSWFKRRHEWTISREHILYTTGVVPAISCALKALTMPGEKVLVLTPVYNCFFSSIRNSGCEVLPSILRCPDNGQNRFEVDWVDFEAKCADEKTTVFLLCNPHNPTGRVWTKAELERMNSLCLKYGIKVVSDEIHCELVMPGYRFQPFAAISDACRDNSVVLNSPSKSFNIAGLQIANIICSNAEWRRRIDRAININEVCDVNPFGPVALVAAYNESEQWLDELCQYLKGNYDALCRFFAQELPQLPVTLLEGTYLVWIDIRRLNLSSDELVNRLLVNGRVWVNAGTMYGQDGFIRINIACPRSQMMEGLSRLAATLHAEGLVQPL